MLTSTLQVSVWGPVKNQLTGKWTKVYFQSYLENILRSNTFWQIEDLADIGLDPPPPNVVNPALFKILQAQLTCMLGVLISKVSQVAKRYSYLAISWSAQTDFLLSPTPDVDGSLLAVGSRAGVLSFFRYKCCSAFPLWRYGLIIPADLSKAEMTTYCDPSPPYPFVTDGLSN